MRAPVFWVVFLVVVGSASADCSGHGSLVDGKCRCDGHWPAPGEQGWTGPQCSVPVFGGTADGRDLTAACGQCGSLAAGNWTCFAVGTPS